MILKRLKVFIEDSTYELEHTFQYIFEIIGIPIYIINEISQEKVDIFYGNSPSESNYKILIVKNYQDLIWDTLIKNPSQVTTINNKIDFDLINAISCFLNDSVNNNVTENAYDVHNRLKAECSFQYLNNINEIPIVNIYIEFLKNIIKTQFKIEPIPLWPDNKNCAINKKN